MFKVGDIVWAKKSGYSMTFYHRPCTVKGYDCLGKLLIEPFDDDSTYDVDDKYFELVPPTDIIEKGQEIAIHGIDRGKRIEFVKYLYNGMVMVSVNGWYEDINIERIIYKRGFYI